jgi:hypothetical protein
VIWLLIVAGILLVGVILIVLGLCRAPRTADDAIREALRESARAHQRGEWPR